MKNFNKIVNILVIALFFIAFFLRLNELQRPLWYDEWISTNTLKVNVIENPLYKGVTTNLPMYFWIISYINFLLHPTHASTLRIFGIILNLINAFILYKHLYYSNSRKAGLFFLLVFLFAPLQIHYSAELRPYVLSQFLASLMFVLLQNRQKKLLLINILAILGLLTHYSFYIFFLGICVLLFVQGTKFKEILKIIIIPVLVGATTIYLMSTNVKFQQSLGDLDLQNSSVSPIYRIFSLESAERLKEVLSSYYYYGLYYYRLDSWAQFIFKKLLIGVFLFSFYTLFSKKSEKLKGLLVSCLVVLIACLFISLIGEKFGYYPFGGRHIMPFSFLLYMIFALNMDFLSNSGLAGKYLSTIFASLLISSFILFQSCSQIYSKKYTGTNDPQGEVLEFCIGNSFKKQVFPPL